MVNSHNGRERSNGAWWMRVLRSSRSRMEAGPASAVVLR